jgi:phenylacetate-coenzyme A ligase PaaK-like adenylate-forming protein
LGTTEGTPLFFHYNPLLDYIEESKDGNLLFTDLDEHRASPRVRYDLGDKGRLLKASTVVSLLKKYGHELSARTNLPLLCLYGRGDDALTFNGANLMYDDLERALAKIPGLYEKINRYAYNKFENKNLDQQLEFWIELKKDISLDGLEKNKINQEVITQLCHVNQDFKAQIEYLKNNKDSQLPLPTTYLYEFGKSPMVAQSGHHKNKYVYDIEITR